MSSPWRGSARVARAAVFALLAVLLAAGAHAAGGGHVPTPGTVALLWLTVLPVAVVLARRTWGPGALTVALGLLELGLHQALSLGPAGGPSAGTRTSRGTGHPTGHRGAMAPLGADAGMNDASHGTYAGMHDASHGTHAGMHPATSHASAADVAYVTGPDHDAGLLMLLGHVVATVLTALLLAHGDALLARLWAWATLRDLPRAEPATLALGVASPPGWRPRAALSPLVAAGGVCRRGPPQG
ncbi:hypothetical protein ACWFNE_13850 [Cellulomonas sp. NPDC055163]